LTGLDRLPDGDFVVLQRFYAPVVGVRIRILRLDGAALARGEVETELLATLAPPLNLDNFESVSAIPTVDGGARLYLISDDNYSRTQRTLLYVFDLPPDS
ncbi:MAG: esterase-like activity of phytase family protein, partial [Alphaproteobacteria bacterium]|nr:esterase-like activity of phytase family protein [Alphaproteobacteria bacterium]